MSIQVLDNPATVLSAPPEPGMAVRRMTSSEPGIVLYDVPWEVYKALRDLHRNRRARMTYLDGTLVLMSPLLIHEMWSELIGVLCRAVAEAFDLEIVGTRQTTLSREGIEPNRGSGKEPDAAYFFGANAKRMRGKTTLDLAVDPPPDLAIEIDHTSDSELALPLYARLGVPEVWIFMTEEDSIRFLGLTEGFYKPIDHSVCLPFLTAQRIDEAFEARRSENLGDVAWRKWIVAWAKPFPQPDRTENEER